MNFEMKKSKIKIEEEEIDGCEMNSQNWKEITIKLEEIEDSENEILKSSESTNDENFEDCNNAAENERDNFSTEQTNLQTWDEITIKVVPYQKMHFSSFV